MQRFSQLTLIPNLCVCVFIHWVVSNSLWPHALQHARFSCPSLSPGVAQIHVHWLSDAIQSFHPLLPPSPPALNHSQHQGLFQWVGSSHQVAKVLNLQFQHQSFHEYSGLISFKIGNARVWAHWNHSFQMHLTYLEPVTYFHILSFLSSGLTTGSGCSLMAAGLAGMLLLPEFL